MRTSRERTHVLYLNDIPIREKAREVDLKLHRAADVVQRSRSVRMVSDLRMYMFTLRNIFVYEGLALVDWP